MTGGSYRGIETNSRSKRRLVRDVHILPGTRYDIVSFAMSIRHGQRVHRSTNIYIVDTEND